MLKTYVHASVAHAAQARFGDIAILLVTNSRYSKCTQNDVSDLIPAQRDAGHQIVTASP
jgi:hypothetical protein